MEYALASLVLTALVALVVAAPLRRGAAAEAAEDARRAELEAAKEAKYREIRDAELDFRMGKVSEPDHRAADRELREEAIGLLEALDRLEPHAGGGSRTPGPAGLAPGSDRPAGERVSH